MRQQEARGKMKKLKGRAKQAVGIITADGALERKGSRERAAGAVQEGLGKARRKVGESIGAATKAIKK